MQGKKIGLLLLALFFVCNGCQKNPAAEFKFFRFIDQLERKNIRQSPFLKSEFARAANFSPAKSFPLLDLGSGENPYGIKKKIRLEGADVNALFSPPPSEYFFELSLPGNSLLEFGIGIVKDENSKKFMVQTEKKKEGVNFLVALEARGKKKVIFQRYLEPPLENEDHTFFQYSLELLHKQKNVRLIFSTEGKGKDFSFWYNPVLYEKGKNRRNIILISIDTLRADHLGVYGYPKETSPHIDALAADSILFLNTYAPSPWTLPSHVSLLTSLFGLNHQIYYENEKMDPSILTLADILRKENFSCSAVTGGGFVGSAYGFSKGFNFFNEAGGLFRQDSAALIARAADDCLERDKNRNFFLFVHTYQPHNPYSSPFPYKTMFLDENARWDGIDIINHLDGKKGIFKSLPEEERRNIISLYDGEIRYTDVRLVGYLIDKLKKMNLYEQTMIVLTSDHGEEFYDHGSWEHGQNLYDESLKVPLIIKFPGSKFKQKRVETIVRLVDVMPTILDELGIDISDLDLDGKSLIPLLNGKERGDREFLADLGDNVMNSHIPKKIAINLNRYKLILNKSFSQEDREFFLFPPPATPSVELYRLDLDFLEKNNQAEKETRVARELALKIEEIYSRAKTRKTGKVELDEKLKEQLRALGYLR